MLCVIIHIGLLDLARLGFSPISSVAAPRESYYPGVKTLILFEAIARQNCDPILVFPIYISFLMQIAK